MDQPDNTSEELFRASCQGDYDAEPAWDAVRALRLRGTEEIFQLAKQYAKSKLPIERARGLDVLAQLGAALPGAERPHRDESIQIARELLRDEDPLVVHSAAWALAHLGGDAAVSALIGMRGNPDPNVRYAVVNGLSESERDDATAAIIELMDDPDENVRDWATFALGTLCKRDSPEIREALTKRLNDTDGNARDEAVWGLAQRRDPNGLRMLMDRLSAEQWMAGDEMAGREVLGVPPNTPATELIAGLKGLLPP